MEDRIGRAVREIFDVVGTGVIELIIGVETRDLQFAFELELLEQRIGEMKCVVLLSEIAQGVRNDQQGGVGFFGV